MTAVIVIVLSMIFLQDIEVSTQLTRERRS